MEAGIGIGRITYYKRLELAALQILKENFMNQVEVKRRQIEIFSDIIGLINICIWGKTLGNNGIAYLVIAWEGFAILNTLTAGSLSDTLGRMLRARNTKGQYKNTINIRKKVFMLEGGIGIVCSILFALCAGLIAEKIFKVPYSSFIMTLLAPVLLLRIISSMLIGFFQGEGTELPAAAAALLRQILLLGFGLLFVNILGNYGAKVSSLLGDEAYTAMYGGAGIAVAEILTEVLIVLFLGLITFGSRRSRLKKESEGMKQTDSFVSIVQILYGSMGIMMLISLFEQLPVWLGTIFYRKSAEDIGSFAQNYGLFAGNYFVICGIPTLLVFIVLLPPAVKTAGAFRKEDYRSAKMMFQSGLHIGMVHALFAAIYVGIMAGQLSGSFCETGADLAADMLRYGSAMILFTALFFYFSRLLQLCGKKYHLLGVLGLVNILFVIVLSVLLHNGKAGVLALIYAYMLSVGSGCIMLGFLCFRLLHGGADWLQVIAIPAGAACVAGLFCMLLGKLFTPHLGNFATAFVCLVLSAVVYWVILLLFRNFKEQELKHMPGGRLILAAGQILHVFE